MGNFNQPDEGQELKRLISKLKANSAVEILHFKRTPPRKDVPDRLHNYPDLLAFYRQVDAVQLAWRVKGDPNPDHSGGLTVLSSKFFDDGKTPFFLDQGEFWMVNGERCQLSGQFFPIEIIEDNAAVGVFSTKGISKDEIFFFDYGIHFDSLKTDWPGYLQMLEKSYGVRYWQTAVVKWEYGEASEDVRRFGETLDLILVGYSLEDFKAFVKSKKKEF